MPIKEAFFHFVEAPVTLIFYNGVKNECWNSKLRLLVPSILARTHTHLCANKHTGPVS